MQTSYWPNYRSTDSCMKMTFSVYKITSAYASQKLTTPLSLESNLDEADILCYQIYIGMWQSANDFLINWKMLAKIDIMLLNISWHVPTIDWLEMKLDEADILFCQI